MKGFRPLLIVAVAALILASVLWSIFQRRVARDLYPEYSSLRADPLGTRALHDALAAVPGMQVERWVKPLDRLPATPPATFVFAGGSAPDWEEIESDIFNAFDSAARNGSRLVIAFRAETEAGIGEREEFEKFMRKLEQGDGQSDSKSESKPRRNPLRRQPNAPRPERDPNAQRPAALGPQTVKLAPVWGLELGHRSLESTPGAQRTAQAPAALPDSLRWVSDRYLKLNPGMGWKILYRRGSADVLAEMPLGRGSVVVACESYFLSNEAVQRDRPTALLSWIVGVHRRVVFVESHLGVKEDPGIAALARRYGLAPAAAVLLLLALLFVWRRSARFVPPEAMAPEVALNYQPAAGLAALLRRALPVRQLVPTAFAEWRKTARPAELARTANAGPAANEAPVAAYNRISAALRRR